MPAASAAVEAVRQVSRIDRHRRVNGTAPGQDFHAARAVRTAVALAQVVQHPQAVPVVAAADWAASAHDRLPQHTRARGRLGMLPDTVRGAAAV